MSLPLAGGGAPETIRSARLDLVPIPLEALDQMIAGDFAAAGGLLGAANPCWPEPLDFLSIFRARLADRPDDGHWLARAIALRDPQPTVVGHIGFHTCPGEGDTVEIGYTVFESHRRQGIATEAARALVRWSFTQGIARVVASIAPANEPSIRVAAALGFRRVGEQVDEVDGLEFIFEVAPASLV